MDDLDGWISFMENIFVFVAEQEKKNERTMTINYCNPQLLYGPTTHYDGHFFTNKRNSSKSSRGDLT